MGEVALRVSRGLPFQNQILCKAEAFPLNSCLYYLQMVIPLTLAQSF